MFYKESEFGDIDIFNKNFMKKIKLFAITCGDNDSFISLFMESHNKYYNLCYYDNYPQDSFLELEEYDSLDQIDFSENIATRFYKIPKENQALKFLNISPQKISSDLFEIDRTRSVPIEELLKGKSNLVIDEKYRINKKDYVSIKKELMNIKDKDNSMEK